MKSSNSIHKFVIFKSFVGIKNLFAFGKYTYSQTRLALHYCTTLQHIIYFKTTICFKVSLSPIWLVVPGLLFFNHVMASIYWCNVTAVDDIRLHSDLLQKPFISYCKVPSSDIRSSKCLNNAQSFITVISSSPQYKSNSTRLQSARVRANINVLLRILAYSFWKSPNYLTMH